MHDLRVAILADDPGRTSVAPARRTNRRATLVEPPSPIQEILTTSCSLSTAVSTPRASACSLEPAAEHHRPLDGEAPNCDVEVGAVIVAAAHWPRMQPKVGAPSRSS